MKIMESFFGTGGPVGERQYVALAFVCSGSGSVKRKVGLNSPGTTAPDKVERGREDSAFEATGPIT